MSNGSIHNIFLGRQPIFDADLAVRAYELLFRHADRGSANIMDASSATSQVILNAFTVLGLEQVCGGLPAYINVTGDFLVRYSELPFPREKVVLELLEGTPASEDVLEVIAAMRGRGYRFALDDFEWSADTERLLPLVQTVKIDVLAHEPSRIRAMVAELRSWRVRLLAEKVETREQFEFCRELGFELFQGFFLSRPSNLSASSIPTNRLPALSLLAALHRPDAEVDELERLIARDVSLSYKLLRYLNSAFFNLGRRIDSIRQAIVFLGLRELRSWASLVALAAVPDKPQALMTSLMIRAKTCELVARALCPGEASTCFTVGLFSGLDALFDVPLSQVLEELPLSEDTERALLERQGEPGRVLEWVLAYETGDWERVSRLGGPVDTLRSAFLEAVAWSEQVASLIRERA
ncbi:HDOD domain-containing protein [Ectothiorhodospiraceae bacterium WFHF3C12]|nr:HDOD domain-containing protein [Ectothiorhodospiraceae bacterium WFHF3C12]